VLCACSRAELAEFGEPDFVIYNGGAFPANKVRSAAAGAKLQQAQSCSRRQRHCRLDQQYAHTRVNVLIASNDPYAQSGPGRYERLGTSAQMRMFQYC
jgi:hypothetical protein